MSKLEEKYEAVQKWRDREQFLLGFATGVAFVAVIMVLLSLTACGPNPQAQIPMPTVEMASEDDGVPDVGFPCQWLEITPPLPLPNEWYPVRTFQLWCGEHWRSCYLTINLTYDSMSIACH